MTQGSGPRGRSASARGRDALLIASPARGNVRRVDSPAAHRSPLIVAAAFVALGYAAVFVLVAMLVGFQLVTATGSIGRERLTGIAARGAAFLIAVLISAAVMLIVGAMRLLRSGRAGWVVGLLGAFVVIGCIGETVDLFGTASGASDGVGAGIIALALIPPVLIAINRRVNGRRQGS